MAIVSVRKRIFQCSLMVALLLAGACHALFPSRMIGNEPIVPPHTGEKFLGNVWSPPQRTDWLHYWNQVTPENEGKWGSVQRGETVWNWGPMDQTYAFAKANGLPIRFHVLIWGNQQPRWMAGLSVDEQRQHIENWFEAVATRYPDLDYVEVVNEPLHDPPSCDHAGNKGSNCADSGDYLKALGGYNDTDGTGWDWVLNAFRLARQHFGPDTKLVINEYNILSSSTNTTQYLKIIELLQAEGLIDVIGVQGHAFSTRGPTHMMRANLDRLAATGLPIQVTEMDIDGPTDEVQLTQYQRVFPLLWEHPAVEGITLWGWRNGMWRTSQGATLVRPDGTPKPAFTWLMEYVQASKGIAQ